MSSCAQQGPVSLRVSVTNRCQLRCFYCMPVGGALKAARCDILGFEEIIGFVGVLRRHFGMSKVHLTGGDPLVRPGLTDLVAMLAREAIGDLALTTNGQLLAAMAVDLRRAGLARVNISLDSLKPETFRWLTRGGDVCRTLQGLEAALECGLAPVKLNVAVLRNVNSDEVVDIARFGLQRGCEVRFLELMPIGPAAKRFEEWFVSSREVRARLEAAFDLRPAGGQPGGSSRNYVARDGQGRGGIIGFISPHSSPFCDDCRRLRLTADGLLIGCLAQGQGQNIRPLVRGRYAPDVSGLVAAIHSVLSLKRRGRRFDTTNAMVQIGG